MYRVLSIDGGGIRGLFSARVLAALEAQLNAPVHQVFNLLGGTSTGGILAAALSRGLPAVSVAEIYRDRAEDIFGRRQASLFGPRYSSQGLRTVLEDVFADARLSAAMMDVMLTAYDLTAASPAFFKSWKAGGEAPDVPYVDACLATSAAPTYFPPAGSDDGPWYVDGGLHSNNPAMCCLAEAIKRTAPDGPCRGQDILMVSVGTGQVQPHIDGRAARTWGMAQWPMHLLEILFDGQADVADYCCKLLLGDRHFRLQVELPREIPMSTTRDDDLDALISLADQVAASDEFSRMIAALADHSA